MADKYLLRVTAGPSYDPSTHKTVLVNQNSPTHIENSLCSASISIKIQNYRGLPRNSPSTSPYFTHPPHLHDQYSISFTLLPQSTITGPSLVFGNDFDHPIRDRLPPGFNAAFRIVKWAIDPGLVGDMYSEKPYLYGNALSSVNILRVGEKVENGQGLDDGGKGGKDEGDVIEEGGDGEGLEWRRERGVPETGDARKKYFLTTGKTAEWEWEAGRVYRADFFNPYLDFNGFNLKLPGFSLSILPYMGGEDYLRYTLKNKDTDEVLFVVVFTLLKKEDVEKEEADAAHGDKAVEQPGQEKNERDHEPQADNLD